MKLLIDLNNLENYKSRDLIPLECQVCHSTFYRQKHYIQSALNGTYHSHETCSKQCQNKNQENGKIYNCSECNKEFYRQNAAAKDKRKKSERNFCGHKCATTFYNKNKTTGFNRSKLEIYLEKELIKLFPTIKFSFNDRLEIGYELDIYIPSLKLAFELNGIFHYEPIYGEEKLEKMQFNDKQKFALCQQKMISLCVIDTTSLKYFKLEKANKFLDIIVKIIKDKWS